MPRYEWLLKQSLFAHREANRHTVSKSCVITCKTILELAIENEVNVVLAGALLLVNVLACVYEEDQASIEEVLEGRALKACEDEVICFDLVHQVIDLLVVRLYS